MGFLDKLANKFAPISDERALEIIRSNLGLIESLTVKYIEKNGSTESVVLNEKRYNDKIDKYNTFQKTLIRVNEAFPEFRLDMPHYYVACYIFHIYANPNLDKDTKKEFSEYLSSNVFNPFIDKACSILWNDVGKLLIKPRTYDQKTMQERVANYFADIMFEYDYVINNRSLSGRNNDYLQTSSSRKRKK